MIRKAYLPYVKVRRGLRGVSFSMTATDVYRSVSYPLSAIPAGAWWEVRISGAQPNAPVTYADTSGAVQQLGPTDAQGNFYFGTSPFDSQAGRTYNSTWSVAGQVVGAVTVTIVPREPDPASQAAAPPPSQTSADTRVYSPSVELEDLTTSGSVFRVGDSYRLTIVGGKPNSPVTMKFRRPDGSAGSYQPGTTDASGMWSTSGAWRNSDAGAWWQEWLVAGQAMSNGSLNFTVAAAETPAISSGSTAIPTASASPATTAAATPNGFRLPDLPLWAWAGIAAAAGALLFGRER